LGKIAKISALTVSTLASGPSWQVSDTLCDAGPADAPYEEQHDRICMAVVLNGTFSYRSSQGRSIVAPGAILLGNPRDHFECGHRHSTGDRCLSFHFDPVFYETILSEIPGGARRLTLDRPVVPPQCGDASFLLPNADAALDDPGAAEEFAYEVAAYVAKRMTDATITAPIVASTAKRIQETARWINPHQPLPLVSLAAQACMSRYHFLREFKRVIGITPHQFVLSLRLRQAARRLRHGNEPVLQIAIEAGFFDLSEFNRRFRRVLGVTPRDYRILATAKSAPIKNRA
jgi:AraC family transcriptional regulator